MQTEERIKEVISLIQNAVDIGHAVKVDVSSLETFKAILEWVLD